MPPCLNAKPMRSCPELCQDASEVLVVALANVRLTGIAFLDEAVC